MSGFTVKVRGGGLTLREYRCPEHGVFEALVPRDAADEQPCPALVCKGPAPDVPAEEILKTPCCECGAEAGAPCIDTAPLKFHLFGRLASALTAAWAKPCGAPSPRTFTAAPAVHTQFVVSVSRGKDDPKPHKNALDLRPLAEGQRYHDWRAERAKVHEAERQRRVMEWKRS